VTYPTGFVPFSLPGGSVRPDVTHRPSTGSWRSQDPPQVDLSRCVNCLLCWAYCPDGAIQVHDAVWQGIDAHLCKGCEICVAVCPTGALTSPGTARQGGG
jgi:2-oxoacid:acceptor oxidoreductase delta subunit (pyruvate/2-ketoisovalerate family)